MEEPLGVGAYVVSRAMTSALAVVIPTFNSAATLDRCLVSLREQTHIPDEVVIVDDVRTTDGTRSIAARNGCSVVVSSAGRARSRNEGFAATASPYLFSVDADMILRSDLLAKMMDGFEGGADALTIREVAIGRGYWARGRALDKMAVEATRLGMSIRGVTRQLFDAIGGYDASLVAGEDLDLHRRAVEHGAIVCHIDSTYIEHDEGNLKLARAIVKKYRYGKTVPAFETKHGSRALAGGFGTRLVTGCSIGAKKDPLAIPGFVALKLGEAVGGLAGRIVGHLHSPGEGVLHER
jgi:glycosyltransferase involved in cell wall biosynthesis